MITPRLGACRELALFGLGLAATFALTVAGALLLFAIGTELALGWSANAMRSGSMAPAIRRGDVLMSIPAPRGRMLGTGTVVVFSGSDQRTTAHRIVGHTPDGDYVTRGGREPCRRLRSAVAGARARRRPSSRALRRPALRMVARASLH